MRAWKKIWRDPVWSAVIATGLVALIGAIITYVLDLWPSIWRALVSAWGYVFAKTVVPNWLLGLLGVCAALVAYVSIRVAWEAITGKPRPTWKNYTRDNFYGLTWGWTLGNEGQVYDLHSLCEKCLYQVMPQEVGAYAAATRYEYRCDS